MSSIKLTFGDSTDADTFLAVFQHMEGYIIELNGKDVELFDVEQPDGEDTVGFVVRDLDENGFYVSDYKFVEWEDIKKVVIY